VFEFWIDLHWNFLEKNKSSYLPWAQIQPAQDLAGLVSHGENREVGELAAQVALAAVAVDSGRSR
jgi:hypothetical protein